MMDLADRVAAALEHAMLPSVIARGAGLRVAAVEGGIAHLEVTGSPGAVLPLAARIEALIRVAVPEITGVRIAGPAARPAREAPLGRSPSAPASSSMRRSTRWSPRTAAVSRWPARTVAGSESGLRVAARAAAWPR